MITKAIEELEWKLTDVNFAKDGGRGYVATSPFPGITGNKYAIYPVTLESSTKWATRVFNREYHGTPRVFDTFEDASYWANIHASRLYEDRQLGHTYIPGPKFNGYDDEDEPTHYPGTNMEVPMAGPWGATDAVTKYGEGVFNVEGSRLAGFFVSEAVQTRIPEVLQISNRFYQDTHQSALLVTALPGYFTRMERYDAERDFKTYYPARYEAFTGQKLAGGQSLLRDVAMGDRGDPNLYIVTSWEAWSNNPGFILCTALRCADYQMLDPESKTFVVPVEEYRSLPDFLIDPSLYAELLFQGTPQEHVVNPIRVQRTASMSLG